jgi:bacterioferritin
VRAPLPPPLLHGDGNQRRGNQGRISPAREWQQQHADWVATRITQLNGHPNFNPEGLLTRSHSEYSEAMDLVSMMKDDLFAERIAIESYSEIVRCLGNDDPTTRKIIEDILKLEEEHAEDLKSLLEKIS